MKFTWRWFGPDDPVSLEFIKRTDATGIVSALHHIENGSKWTVEEIKKRKDQIIHKGLTWDVVESVPVHEDIKRGSHSRDQYIENYIQTIRNLSKCGINTICYNFMPALDWLRTDLNYPLPDGSATMGFNITMIAIFDIFILKRVEAENDYSIETINEAKRRFAGMSTDEKYLLKKNLIGQLPGSEENHSLTTLKKSFEQYRDIDGSVLKMNLYYFLDAVIPEAEKAGVKLCIHPDDPPRSILGLPRIMSTENDIEELLDAVKSPANGITFCTGSYGARANNDLIGMIRKFGDRFHFLHFRNVRRKDDGSFYESGHKNGDLDMYEIIRIVLKGEKRRKEKGRKDWSIPVRADHGLNYSGTTELHPGYSAEGRRRGLEEIMEIYRSLVS